MEMHSKSAFLAGVPHFVGEWHPAGPTQMAPSVGLATRAAQLENPMAISKFDKHISKFGRQWNPKLKTTTENPGIDIKGKPGSAIRSVLGGIVTTITYIRGYGTTLIIDHGGGFYTVYSHVTNIQTSVDSQVRNGDVIAYMGDSGSINGSKLHFEIWGKGQKLDPEKWLIKK